MDDVISLHNNIFINIHSREKELLKDAFSNYENNSKEFFITIEDNNIYQGDIIEKVNLCIIDENGKELLFSRIGMIITNTCDITRRDSIIIAPVFEYSELVEQERIDKITLKKNRYYRFFYIPESNDNPSLIVSLGLLCSCKREYIYSIIKTKKAKKILSLTKKGHCLFNIKLLTNLLRSESSDVKRN